MSLPQSSFFSTAALRRTTEGVKWPLKTGSGILASGKRNEAGLIFAELDIDSAALGIPQPPRLEGAQHELPYHEAAKAALFNALAISSELGHTSTGADHVLLSLVREAPEVRKRLAEAGVDEDVLLATVVKCRRGKK